MSSVPKKADKLNLSLSLSHNIVMSIDDIDLDQHWLT